MTPRAPLTAVILVAMVAAGQAQTRSDRPTGSSEKPNFSGDWILNRELSDAADAPDSRGDERPETAGRRGGFGGHGGRGGYGGRGGFGGGHRGAPPEAAADRARILEAVGDARSPSPSLTISHSPANVAITDARGRTRFFQTNGAKDKHQLEAGTIDSTTSWNGDLLVTQYDLGGGRRLTYTYSLLAETKQLVVRVHVDRAGQSGGHGGPNTKYVYDAVRRK